MAKRSSARGATVFFVSKRAAAQKRMFGPFDELTPVNRQLLEDVFARIKMTRRNTIKSNGPRGDRLKKKRSHSSVPATLALAPELYFLSLSPSGSYSCLLAGRPTIKSLLVMRRKRKRLIRQSLMLPCRMRLSRIRPPLALRRFQISQAKREDVPALLALYGLFNSIIPEEDRRPNWEGFLGKYRAEMDKCGIELLTVRVLFSDIVPDWKTSEVLAVIDAYDRSKHNPREMKFPRVIDLALLAAIANNQLDGNEMALFDTLTDRMLLDAAGMNPVQDHIRQAKEKRERMDLRTILGLPPVEIPVEQASQGAGGESGGATPVESKPQEVDAGVS